MNKHVNKNKSNSKRFDDSRSQNAKGNHAKSKKRFRSDSGKTWESEDQRTTNQRNEIKGTVDHMKSQRNDFNWYDKYKLYTEYAGTVAFGKPLGETFDLSNPGTTFNAKEVIPGIMAIRFIPTPGYSENRNSPINRSAIRWYSALRRMQKASADYDSQDAMISMLSVDSLAMFHETLKRIVGVGNLNSVLNRYVPEGLLTAMGVDPIDVRDNAADWWGYCNKFAIDASNVTMPKDLSLRNRHSWMCEGIYTDGNSERSQIYIFVPDGFWKYNNTVVTGSQLEYIKFAGSNGLMKLADVKAIGDAMLSAVFGDEDIGTICGDIYNAIGASNCYTFDQITSNYTVTALYSEMVLSQIENSTAVGFFAQGYTPVISQDPSVNAGAILFQPQFAVSNIDADKLTNKKTYLNFHNEKPDVEQVIEATRLRVGLADSVKSGVYMPKAFGSEVICQYEIYLARVGNPQQFIGAAQSTNIDFASNDTFELTKAKLQAMCNWFAFDWAPIVYIFYTSVAEAGNTIHYIGRLVDFDVTTILEPSKLAEMHEAALTSEFDIPEKFL